MGTQNLICKLQTIMAKQQSSKKNDETQRNRNDQIHIEKKIHLLFNTRNIKLTIFQVFSIMLTNLIQELGFMTQ